MVLMIYRSSKLRFLIIFVEMKLIRFLLFPIAVLFDLITSIRNLFFDWGFFKQHRFKLPVIVVGNLNVGGTGKSPQIEYLIRLLKDEYQIAILSRGYKRKTKNFQIIDSNHTSEDVGDEPLQFYKKFDEVDVAVDFNRVNGINQLIKDVRPQLILLDDAFQHRKVKGSLYILLTKYNDLYSDDFVLPTGNLRESRRGAKRADIIIITKCPQNMTNKKRSSLVNKLKLLDKQQIYFSSIKYDKFIYSNNNKLCLSNLKNTEIIVVTGIANPVPLLDHLSQNNIKFNHIKFPDHHNFSEKDFIKIKKMQGSLNTETKIVLTTEKDFVRFETLLNNLFYLPIQTVFLEEEEQFNDSIMNHIKNKID